MTALRSLGALLKGGADRLTAISESAMYSLIMRSPAARKSGTFPFRFCEWLADEVLPALRKDGVYSVTERGRALLPTLVEDEGGDQ
jgi:prophage antirepressor-like protein